MSKRRGIHDYQIGQAKKVKAKNLDPLLHVNEFYLKELILQHLKADFTQLTEVSPLWNKTIGESPTMMGTHEITVTEASIEAVMRTERKYEKVIVLRSIEKRQQIEVIQRFSKSIIQLSITGDPQPEPDNEDEEIPDEVVFNLPKLTHLGCYKIDNDFAESLLKSCGKKLQELSLSSIKANVPTIRACLIKCSGLENLMLSNCPEGILDAPEDFKFKLKKLKFFSEFNVNVSTCLQAFLQSQRASLKQLNLFVSFEVPEITLMHFAMIPTIDGFRILVSHPRQQFNHFSSAIFQFVVNNMRQLETFRFEDSTGDGHYHAAALYEQMKANQANINTSIDLQVL